LARRPRCPETAAQHALIHNGGPDMVRSMPDHPAMEGHDHLGKLRHKHCLLLRRQHQVSVTLLLVRQRRKNPPAHPEVHSPHVRALLRSLQAQRNPPKVLRIHAIFTETPSRIADRGRPCVTPPPKPLFPCKTQPTVRLGHANTEVLMSTIAAPGQLATPDKRRTPYFTVKLLTSAAIVTVAVAFVLRYVFRYYLHYNQAA